MDALVTSLSGSPELFPVGQDPATDTVSLIRLSAADYLAASFLDGRLLSTSTLLRTLGWDQLTRAVQEAGILERCGYIFHIGHVGSTLISRLLGACPAIFALREPGLLRDLALQRAAPESALGRWTKTAFESRLGILLKLWSRTFRSDQLAVIKATSFVSELAADILSRPSQPRAIFMHVPAETYLAAILGAPNSPREARLLAESRLDRVHRRLSGKRWTLSALSEGEIVAMSWACEMLALSAASDVADERGMWLNFDSFLCEPAGHLREAFRHFGVEDSVAEAEKILSGPEMHRYSKAPEHAYDSALRTDILAHARRRHATEIARGLKWLDQAGLASLGPTSPR